MRVRFPHYSLLTEPTTAHKFNDMSQDDLRDLAIQLVNELVKQGVVRDCTDTDLEDEFIAQDLIVELLEKVTLKK